MKAAIISIGDELLIGQVVNTNAAWIAEQLSLNGIQTKRIYTIADEEEDILDCMEATNAVYDFVFMTGGLGPTRDDITKKCLAKYFDCELVTDEQVLEDVNKFFVKRGRPLNDLNRAQALVPEGCRVIRNPNGTAPGLWHTRGKAVFISMPGVPYEMKAMMQDSVLPLIRKEFSLPAIYHTSVLTQGIGEAVLAEKLEAWEKGLQQKDIMLAYLPQPGMVKLRLSAQAQDFPPLKEKVEQEVARLYEIAGKYIFGREEFGGEETSLQKIVSRLLKERNQTVSLAESCTGGYISHLITSIPGSSKIFNGSVVAYSNEAKQELLDISTDIITRHGAVSAECVEAMARRARDKFRSDYAIAVSGIAGPGGGTTDKPVGTVWIAISTKQKTDSEKFLFGDNRQRNIIMAAQAALNLLRKTIV